MKTRLLFLSGITFVFILSSQVQVKIISNNNVEIGTDTPAEKLHINGSIRGNQNGALRINTGYGYIDVGPANTSFAHFYAGNQRFYFNKIVLLGDSRISSYSTNNLLLYAGHDSPNTRITVSTGNGNVGICRSPHSTAKPDVAGDIAINGTIKLTSDIRLKENIRPMDASFNKLALLQLITFNYTKDLNKASVVAGRDMVNMDTGWQEVEDAFTKKVRYGFSVQDVQKIYLNLVTEDSDGCLSIDFMGLIPVLVQTMKEQQVKIS
jgi:hypothetical protein